MNDIPEISFRVTSVEVKSEVRPLSMTVRNTFYKGFSGKIKTMWAWLRWHSDDSFSGYLNSPVTYSRELSEDVSAYHNINAEAELVGMLQEEEE